ncbi:MAG TPA: toll/interleukin-1 receptor domain-containing protein [Anaerolineales bacterium]|nr:toll/interleukin-1 receptor domain-containing protein [Anaerolineales bacterium]
MSHIFISYSRRDLTFAQKIVDALAAQNVEMWIDWKSIPKGEDWEQEIYRGIEAADALLFLISPDSIRSKMCNTEIIHALKSGKRILPVLLKKSTTSEFLDETAKREIERLNWVFIQKDIDDFDGAIEQIRKTIRTDYDWVRFHTTLLTKALAWERAGEDASRLLRGKELAEAEKQIADSGPATEPFLTDLQRQFLTKSRQSVKRRQALPYSVLALLAATIFLGGKFFYLILPISSACPEVGSVSFEIPRAKLTESTYQTLLEAIENGPSKTARQNCELGAEELIYVTFGDSSAGDQIELSVRLPEIPAYQLDLLQEIREFGPELVEQSEAIALLNAFSAYSVGEYQTSIDLLTGYDSLSSLTLLAQAQLFRDDLGASREAYDLALQKTQPDSVYTGKLNMGAALALWRPESYYLLSFEGKKEDCKAAAIYYSHAMDQFEADKLAHNVRILYANYCFTDNDKTVPGLEQYAVWKDEAPQSESDLQSKDATYINATEQYILALRERMNKGPTLQYRNHLISAQPLMLARAALSDFYWKVDENCAEARVSRDEFRSSIYSGIEKWSLERLLQSQPFFCRS